ncbi:hypothetical protein DFH06DRAFT_1315532 [Mycena polygramma]|nr:hypothetical protein DFH06DRAFT_1315532 [Mycena polygramma]
MPITTEDRERYSRELAEYTMRQFTAARKTLDNHKAAAAKLPALHAARDGSMVHNKGFYPQNRQRSPHSAFPFCSSAPLVYLFLILALSPALAAPRRPP